MKRNYALAIAFFILLVIAGGYKATHHPVYGGCHQNGPDTICKLVKWEGNK